MTTKVPAELSSTPSISDSASATAITIDSSGNVGIGGSPSAKLDVNTGTTNTLAHFHSTDDNAFIEIKDDDTQGYIGVQNDYLYIGSAPSNNAQNINIHQTTGEVGIGTTAPSDYDNNAAGISSNLVVKDSGHAGIIVISGASSDAAISFGDGTGTAAYRGAVAYVNSADALYFKAGGNNKLRLDSDGLKFNSDTAAANALDDYEEGTWTPATYSGTVATATGTARYHKIGGLVVASCRLNTFSDTSGSDHVRITGLPFRIVTPANKNCGYAWSNEATVFFYGQPDETQVWLYHNGSSGFQDVSYSELSSSTQYMCLFTYFTDQ